jgi:aspartate aminotransferase-like enzyme
VTAARFAAIEAQVAALLQTEQDVVLVQAEAILALEAIARGVGMPGAVCLNVVTGPYGVLFGSWLRAAGSDVIDLAAPYDRAIGADEVDAALERRPDVSVLALVHAEAATGVVNPVCEIAAIARRRGVLTILDAVASVGAHDLPVDEFGLDFCAAGPQKGLGGPAGVSAVSVSERGWEALRRSPAPWRSSSLSLLDWKELWIDDGRRSVPGTPAVLELLALEAACERVAAAGLDKWIARHQRCAAAFRAGVRGLGLEPWARNDAQASAVCTTVPLPAGCAPEPLLTLARERFGFALVPGYGELYQQLVRIDHMGAGAEPSRVVAALAALGGALAAQGVDVHIGRGVEAAVRCFATDGS